MEANDPDLRLLEQCRQGDIHAFETLFRKYQTYIYNVSLGMLGNGDLFAAAGTPPAARAISAGMFGSGFTFRLARAEAEAAGGALVRHEDCVRLELPVLTATAEGFDRGETGGSTAA